MTNLTPGTKGAITRMVNKDFDNLTVSHDEAERILFETPVGSHATEYYVKQMSTRLANG